MLSQERNLSDPEFKELVLKLSLSDEAAFLRIYNLYKDKIYAFAMRFLRSGDLAKDIVQQTFMKLWEVRERLNTDLSLNAYLFKIARNLLMDHIRKYRFEAGPVTAEMENRSANEVEESIFYNEARTLEGHIIAGFPPQRQQVYKLHREDSLSYQEIADKLGVSKNTVKTHLKLAVKELREKFRYSGLFLILLAMLRQF